MKLLRDILALCVSVVVMLAMTSCGGHSDRPGLVALDSLILQDPDSACELLAAYPADSLPTADDRAYHALLTTIADYKAYRPATTDSVINFAVNHYDHNGANQDHRMRSLLYKGCVKEELGEAKAAMRCYKEAQYACPDNDNFHKGYIQYRIAALFQSVAEVEQAVYYYKKAINAFIQVQEKYYYINCLNSIGEVLRDSEPDTALIFIKKGLELALERNDEYHIFAGYSNLAGYYFSLNHFEQAIKYSLLAIENNKETLGNNDVFYFACKSFLEKDKIDSAQMIFNLIPSPKDINDSILYCRCLSDIYLKKGNIEKSYYFSEEVDKLQCITNKNNDNGLVQISSKYDQKHIERSNYWILFCVISVALSFIVYLFIIYYKRKNQAIILRTDIENLNRKLCSTISKLTTIQDGQNRRNQDIETLKRTLSQYMEVLKNAIPWGISTRESRNPKINKIMNNTFFMNLYGFIDIEYPNLINILRNRFQLKEDEIRIVCLELCHFPNYLIWSSTNLTNIHSLINKKKIIARKVNNSESINEIINSLQIHKN